MEKQLKHQVGSPFHKRISKFGKTGKPCNVYSQDEFHTLLERERARANRNGHAFSLVAFDMIDKKGNGKKLKDLQNTLLKRLRTTDVVGWIDQQRMGSILYDVSTDIARNIAQEIRYSLTTALPIPDIEIYTYPSCDQKTSHETETALRSRNETCISPVGDEIGSDPVKTGVEPTKDIHSLYVHRMPVWKRCMDIAGSFFGLLILSPIFIVVACWIRLVSPGPVFFRQERIGYGRKKFKMMKFRTMHCEVNNKAHRTYYATLINESGNEKSSGRPMTKLDEKLPCIRFASFLRNTAIDELPQLFNVLRGEMSLVGPRPPISYEVEEYLMWHHNRFDTIPGMTGLWQVSGKNKLSFKEMIRLDIRYSKDLSFWLDMKILMKTPITVISQTMDFLYGKYKRRKG